MRLVVGKEPLRRILKWAQRALFACAVLLLGYCGLRSGGRLDVPAAREHGSRPLAARSRAAARARNRSPPLQSAPAAAADGLIGRIEIPRLLLSVVVVEGIDKTTLRRAVGHIPGTALPGQPGNVGLAGHRDTFFRPLKDLRIKDEVQFSTLQGDFKYEVESLRVVEPDNVGVLAASAENVLTLVTCYPFYYVGPAPQRWIVRARQVVR